MEPAGAWQSKKIGPGPAPIETTEGWLLIYHGVLQSCNGFVYHAGAALLDLDEAIRLAPADANHYVAKAELLIMNKKKKEARKMLDKATRLGVSRYALKEWYEKCR
jgi:hypothetical protein